MDSFLEYTLIPACKNVILAEKRHEEFSTCLIDNVLKYISKTFAIDIFELRKHKDIMIKEFLKKDTKQEICKGRNKKNVKCTSPATCSNGFCKRHSDQYEKTQVSEILQAKRDDMKQRFTHSHIFRGAFLSGCPACEAYKDE